MCQYTYLNLRLLPLLPRLISGDFGGVVDYLQHQQHVGWGGHVPIGHLWVQGNHRDDNEGVICMTFLCLKMTLLLRSQPSNPTI